MLLLPMAALAFSVGANLFFYQGSYDPPPSNLIAIEDVTLPSYPTASFSEPPGSRQGVFLIDFSHFNDFSERELNTLVSKVANRGYTVELIERQGLLEEKLRGADGFAVILPRQPYSKKRQLFWSVSLKKAGGSSSSATQAAAIK